MSGDLGNVLNLLLGDSGGISGSSNCSQLLPLQGVTGSYFALNPARVLDTRNGTGTIERAIPARSAISVQMAAVGADGKIKLYNGSNQAVHLVVDVTGYVTGSTLSVG